MGTVINLEMPTARDIALEREIDHVRSLLLNAIRNDVKGVYASTMAELIGLRSPAQIARMERSRGLA